MAPGLRCSRPMSTASTFGAPLPPGQECRKCTDDLLAEWRAAAAANADVIVTTALLRYNNNLGPRPDKAQMDGARHLRAVATALLHKLTRSAHTWLGRVMASLRNR